MFFICTEELNNATVLLNLARQLGLPDYDFEKVIAEGAFNVGGHRGYDKATSWEEIASEKKSPSSNATTTEKKEEDEIPLSDSLKAELLEFLKPFNERLFELVGKRCDW